MQNVYLDLLLNLGKFYRHLTKILQNELKNKHKINMNYMEFLILYEIEHKNSNITPQILAKEGEYMANHLIFNLKNLERSSYINLSGESPLFDFLKIKETEQGKVLVKHVSENFTIQNIEKERKELNLIMEEYEKQNNKNMI